MMKMILRRFMFVMIMTERSSWHIFLQKNNKHPMFNDHR